MTRQTMHRRINHAPDPPFGLYIPVRVLRQFPREAELVLRASAAANAITTLDRLNPNNPLASAATRRDAVQVSLMMAGYFFELKRTFERDYADDDLGWELALLALGSGEIVSGVPWTLEQVREQFKDGSVLMRVAKTYRNKFGFHWDAAVFKPLTERFENDKLIPFILQEELGMPNTVFEAAQMALIDHFPPEDVKAAMDTIAQLAPMMTHLVVAMINGLLLKAGEIPHVRSLRDGTTSAPPPLSVDQPPLWSGSDEQFADYVRRALGLPETMRHVAISRDPAGQLGVFLADIREGAVLFLLTPDQSAERPRVSRWISGPIQMNPEIRSRLELTLNQEQDLDAVRSLVSRHLQGDAFIRELLAVPDTAATE